MKTSAKSALDLSAKKKALLQKMLKQAGGNASPAHLQERSDDWTSACISACSFEQHGQWFLAQLAPGRSSEIQRLVLRLNGLADYSVIQQTVQKLVHRHPILRASFPNQDGMMAYERIPDDMIDITVVDMSHITATNHAFIALLEHYGQMPFDIGKGPLCHITLFHTMDGPVVLFILHTLIADHATLGILQQDFIALYDHLIGSTIVAVPDIAHTYADYVEWQHQYRHSPEFQTHLAYWQQALSDAVLELNLPRDTTRHRPMFDSSTSHSIIIPSDINNQLSMFCQASDIDPEQVFLSVLYLLLYRYTHQSDMILGYLSKNRSTKARQHIVGPCANIVMLRMALSDTLAGTTLLSSVGETLAAIQPYADVPFTCVAEHVYPTHDLSQSPLYQVFFAYYNDVWYGGSGVNTSAQRLSVPLVLRSAPQTVGFIFHTTEHGTTLTCTYDNTQFTQLSITRFQQHYLSLLQTLLCQPEQTITTYPFHAPNAAGLVSTRSEHQCQLEHSTTVVPGTSPVSISIPTSKLPLTSMLYIHQRIEYYAAQNPDALAIVDSTTHLTYQELNTQANQLAHYLMTKGVRSEVLVGVCIERSPMLIVCLLAIVKTGATYLPLDPAYPTERIHVILEDAQAALLLTHGHNIECSDRWQGAIIDLVQLSSTLSAQRSENPSCDFVDHQRAYVIYTSGSTGKPKGVEIEHYSLLNLISWHQSTFVVGEHDRATLIAAPSFDASVWEIWPYLSTGACLHIPDETLRTMPEQLRDWLVDHDITCCFVPTPLAEQLLDLPWPQSTALRYMLTGGDRLHRYPPADVSFVLVNNYGPTECTVVTTSGAVSETSNETHLPTIGPPIANMQAHVLDQYGTEVPIGVVGELYIGGVGVARGYLNRPALTATRFVPNPFSGIYNQQNTESRPSSSVPGSRLYCTGDLVRWLPGEVIEFVGRIDDQVKVRGFRIELGEVEATLSRHPHVKACVVLAHKDTTDATKLVAYVVPQHFEQVTETACSNALDSSASLIPSEFISLLRQHLSSQLPFYMIPALFVVLDVLPMTPHGKIDRQALPLPQSIRSDDTICTLETTTEKLLADLWSKVLQKNICDRADHFFELGGDSLRATQLLAQLQAHFSIQLTQRELFAAPTIAQLADLIDQQDAPSVSTPPLGRRVYDDIIPLSFAQQRLWFLDQLEPGNAAYNIPLAISITGPLNRLALYQAMREIICRHETLRTTFQVQHGKPHQVIHKNPTVAIKIIELNRAPTTIPDAVVRSKIEEEIHHPFHLACGPLLRMFLLQTQSQVHIFVITLHHIISDGWSVGVLVQELNVLYNAFVQQLPAPLPALPIQYADFAYWQQESLYGIHLNDQQSYWVQQLHDATPYLNLPTDYPRPPVQSFEGTSCLFQMSEEFSQQLRAFSKQEGVTLFMTLLAALGIVLTRICEQDEIVVAAPIANRTHHEVTNLIGFFVNTLALRVALSGDLDGHTLLAQVHTTTLESYNHQDIPFIQVVEALKPPRDTSRSPFSQVFLTLQNVPIPEVQLKDLSVQPINLITEKTKADLSFTFLEHKEGLQLEIQYSTHLFSIGTIKRIQHQYRATLEYLVNYPEWKISHLWTQVSDTIQRTYE